MLRRFPTMVMAAALVAASASPARAQDQSVTFNVGWLFLNAEDARADNDVLFENQSFLAFEIDDFNFVSFGGEWNIGAGYFFEASVGLGYYQRAVDTVYLGITHRDGSEIEQTLKLRIVPVTFLGKYFPMGRTGPVQPYVGGGLGLLRWRYSETGEFVDFTDRTSFRASYVEDDVAAAPVFVGGVRFPIGDKVRAGGEYRYHRATGDLSTDFLTDTIDLGGSTALFTVQFKF